MIERFLKRMAPLGVIAMGAGISGCNMGTTTINGEQGVPLADLEVAGSAPTALLVTGPDSVILTEGDSLNIDVEGDPEAVEAVRFVLDGDVLGITREDTSWDMNSTATVRVTMPAAKDITITGSGSVEAATLAESADIAILGSGSLAASGNSTGELEVSVTGSGSARLGDLDAQSLEIYVGGSGGVSASGTSKQLEIALLGSGGASLADLKTDDAEVSIMGSGSTRFQSDGSVEASIMGSGSVFVTGSATCKESAMGSGSLVCKSS